MQRDCCDIITLCGLRWRCARRCRRLLRLRSRLSSSRCWRRRGICSRRCLDLRRRLGRWCCGGRVDSPTEQCLNGDLCCCSWADNEASRTTKPTEAIAMNKYSAVFFMIIRLLRFPGLRMASVEESVCAAVAPHSSVEVVLLSKGTVPRPQADSWRRRAPALAYSVHNHAEPVLWRLHKHRIRCLA